jgi:hypothetical protein
MCEDYEIIVDLDADPFDVIVDIPELSFLVPGPSAGVFSPVDSFKLISEDGTQGWEYFIDGSYQFFIIPQTGVITGAKSLDLKSTDGHLWVIKPNGNGLLEPVDTGYVSDGASYMAMIDFVVGDIVSIGVDLTGVFTKKKIEL